MNDLLNRDPLDVNTPLTGPNPLPSIPNPFYPQQDLLRPTPHLPATASAYASGKRKRIADPLGRMDLPDTREALDRKLLELCNRLAAAGGKMVSAAHLVAELDIKNERALRLLMAYGHVQHRIRSLVGVEGGGYCWGELAAGAYDKAAAVARRKGLCSMFLASLYSRRPAAVEMAQMAMGFKHDVPGAGGEADELDVWMAGESVTPSAIVEAIVDFMAETPDGRTALAEVGRTRADLLMPHDVRSEMLSLVEQIKERLTGLGRVG